MLFHDDSVISISDGGTAVLVCLVFDGQGPIVPTCSNSEILTCQLFIQICQNKTLTDRDTILDYLYQLLLCMNLDFIKINFKQR